MRLLSRKCITFNWWKGFRKRPSCHAPAQVEQARALLEMILDNENTLKALLKVRMDELRNLIDQTGKQQSITSTYGKLSGIFFIQKVLPATHNYDFFIHTPEVCHMASGARTMKTPPCYNAFTGITRWR